MNKRNKETKSTRSIPYETSRSVYSLLQICCHICSRSANNLQMIYRLSADYLQNVCRISAECLQSVCSDDLQQVCKFVDALQTKSAYHVKQKAHKMHQSNNVYLKDKQGRSVCYSSKVSKLMLTDKQIISLAGI